MESELETFKKYPLALESPAEMDTANASIKIYEGNIILKCKGYEFFAEGDISFNWFPIIQLAIKGEILKMPHGMISFSGPIEPFEIFINDVKFGESYINLRFLAGTNSSFRGSVLKSIYGDEATLIDKIRFCIPNLKQFGGDWIRTEKEAYPGRISLPDKNYKITLDQNYNFRELENILNETGGYIFTYTGEIQVSQSALSFKQTEDTMFCLSVFLGFINGSFTSPIFWEASYDAKHIWTNYNKYKISPYRYSYIPSWSDYNSYEDIPSIWSSFSSLWKDADTQKVLIYAIRWYLEANAENIYGESKTMIVQAALELICNWFLTEHKKIIIGKDADSISAAGKLRLLLSHLKIELAIPTEYSILLAEAKQYNYEDGPDALVQIRNAIIHSQAKKRERLARIEEEAKWQALQLGLWYLELSLLAIFKHNGYYNNRINLMSEIVPWFNSPLQ